MTAKLPTAREFLLSGAPTPDDLRVAPLRSHEDPRGAFTELYRDEWDLGPRPPQWNVAHSTPNTLRGVHTHSDHHDYLVTVAGEMVLGLRDSRVGSATFGRVMMLRLEGHDPHMVVIPPGISHGFYFTKPSTHIYGVTAYFVRPEEATCRWDDPDLEFDWPCTDPLLSPKDAEAGSYRAMLSRFSLPEAA